MTFAQLIDELTQDDFTELIDGVLANKRKRVDGVETDEPLLSSSARLNIYKPALLP